jgi:hypothetical protein
VRSPETGEARHGSDAGTAGGSVFRAVGDFPRRSTSARVFLLVECDRTKRPRSQKGRNVVSDPHSATVSARTVTRETGGRTWHTQEESGSSGGHRTTRC